MHLFPHLPLFRSRHIALSCIQHGLTSGGRPFSCCLFASASASSILVLAVRTPFWADSATTAAVATRLRITRTTAPAVPWLSAVSIPFQVTSAVVTMAVIIGAIVVSLTVMIWSSFPAPSWLDSFRTSPTLLLFPVSRNRQVLDVVVVVAVVFFTAVLACTRGAAASSYAIGLWLLLVLLWGWVVLLLVVVVVLPVVGRR